MSKRCYQSVYWWDGEYEANCVLPEGHSGNHVDELGRKPKLIKKDRLLKRS